MELDFHKVAEDESYEVYQAMSKTKLAGRYTPMSVKSVDADTAKSVFATLKERKIDSVTISQDGITVRLKRVGKYELKEAGIERLG